MLPVARILLIGAAALAAESNYSQWVWPGPNGRLMYRSGPLGDRIPDFSAAGYRYGAEPLPDTDALFEAARIVTVAPPASGDAGDLVQQAIDRVSGFTPDAAGFRGMVRFEAGEFRIGGQLQVRVGGVVLRGAGDGEGGTVLRATGKDQRPLILVDPGSGSISKTAGSERRILDKYVPTGATSLRVESAGSFRPGDAVVVFRPSTAEWIRDLGMDRIPGAATVQWAPGSKDLVYERVVTGVEGDRVFLDAPVCNSFDRRYGGGTVYKYTFRQRIRNVGIEHLAGVSDHSGPTDEDHSWEFLHIDRTEHGWVRNVTARHFSFAAVNLGDRSKNITVREVACLDPVSRIEGSRRYSFNLDGSLVLVEQARARAGRHDFVNGSLTHGPNVFLRSTAENAYDESGPHHRWSTGTLFDNLRVQGGRLAAWNRGEMGTGHGWSGANMVFWNSQAAGFLVQNPFTAQNWVIGGIGPVITPKEFLNGPLGIFDSHGSRVSLGDLPENPDNSLYAAQWIEKRSNPGVRWREYLLGDYDGFAAGDAEDEAYVDPEWRARVEEAGDPAAGFDDPRPGRRVPFTFVFAMGAGEQIRGATLTLAVKRTAEAAPGEWLWLGNGGEVVRLAPAGLAAWFEEAGGAAVVVIELTGGQLALLGAGRLSGAAGPGIAVDWARLDLAVHADAGQLAERPAPPAWLSGFPPARRQR